MLAQAQPNIQGSRESFWRTLPDMHWKVGSQNSLYFFNLAICGTIVRVIVVSMRITPTAVVGVILGVISPERPDWLGDETGIVGRYRLGNGDNGCVQERFDSLASNSPIRGEYAGDSTILPWRINEIEADQAIESIDKYRLDRQVTLDGQVRLLSLPYRIDGLRSGNAVRAPHGQRVGFEIVAGRAGGQREIKRIDSATRTRLRAGEADAVQLPCDVTNEEVAILLAAGHGAVRIEVAVTDVCECARRLNHPDHRRISGGIVRIRNDVRAD